MARDSKGRFEKGFCGNPNGRPRKEPREFTNTQMRRDFLTALEEPVTVPIDGKRTTMSAIELITKQLIRKAAAGNERCMFKVLDLRRQTLSDSAKKQMEYFMELLDSEEMHRRFPDAMTDEMLAAMRTLRDCLAENEIF